MRQQLTGYQVRPSGGTFHVFTVMADGAQVPVDRQRSVFSHGSRDRAQVICDALNTGLLSRAVAAVNAERKARA
jgi:hypothetical protein